MQKRVKKFMALFMSSLVVLGLSGCNNQASSAASVLNVKTATADKHKLQTTLSVVGVLVPTQTVNVSSKISGQVITVGPDVGNSITANDTVITLETKTFNAQLQQAEASLQQSEVALQSTQNQAEQANINLDSASKAYDRTKALFESKAIPENQLDDASTKLQLAKKAYENATGPAQNQIQASINTAKASINNISVQLENANITSPINGIVVNRNINPGEIASIGTTLLTIADTSTLKLKGTVSQDALPFLKQDQEIDIAIDIYPNKVFKGQISNIGPMAVSTGTYFPIEISIKNSEDIKAGLTAHATINITTEEGMVIPASAVIQNNGENYVFVIKNNIVSKRIVTLGLKNDKEIEILKGLDTGEKVASTNVNNLFDNMPVNAN